MFHVFVFFALVLVSLALDPCPLGSIPSVDQDSCFVPLTVDSFYAAELSCLQMGGHLPSIKTEAVNEQLATMAEKYFSCDSLWIGWDVREQWLDGTATGQQTFAPWTTDLKHWPNSQCGILNMTTSGNYTWSSDDCVSPRGYVCAIPVQSPPPTTCSFSNKAPPPTPAPVKVKKTQLWSFAALIALQNSGANNDDAKNNLGQAVQFLQGVTGHCDKGSSLLVITPSTSSPPVCNRTTTTSDPSLSNLLNNIDLSSTLLPANGAPNAILGMFQALANCTSNQNLGSNQGGVVYFLSDVDCSTACSDVIVSQQAVIIDQIIQSGYIVRFGHIGSDVAEAGCLSSILSRCWQYNPAVCDMGVSDDLSQLAQNSNMTVCADTSCTTTHKPGSGSDGMPEGWVIAISVISALTVLALVSWRIYARWKKMQLKARELKHQETIHMNNATMPMYTYPTMPPLGATAIPNDYQQVAGQTRKDDEWEIEPENLLFSDNDVLGSGAFATVYLGRLKGDIPLVKRSGNSLKLGIKKEPDDTYKVAVKRLPPHATTEGRVDFQNEIDFMKALGYHPHVLSLLGVVSSTHDALIVVENCENGDLLSYIRANKDNFSTSEIPQSTEPTLRPKDLVSIAWQVTDGMNYLCSQNFIHRDIAARNILLTKHMVAKIGDFGLCRLVDSALYTAKGGRLPIKWMAPESLKYYEYTFKSDVWSLGVLLWELFSLGEAPYQTVQPQDMPKYLERNRLPQPASCPNQVFKIMNNCWATKSEDRPVIEEIREELTGILNSDSESYGYLSMQDNSLDFDETFDV